MTTQAPRGPAPLAQAVAGELVAGFVLGGVLAPILAVATALIVSVTPLAQQLGMGLLLVQLYVGLLGYSIGAALGIWLVGRMLRQGGSLRLALLGAIICTVLTIVLVRLLGFGENTSLLVILVVAPLILALLGYNLRRRPV